MSLKSRNLYQIEEIADSVLKNTISDSSRAVYTSSSVNFILSLTHKPKLVNEALLSIILSEDAIDLIKRAIIDVLRKNDPSLISSN